MGAGLRGVGRRNDAKRHIGVGGSKNCRKSVAYFFMPPYVCAPTISTALKVFGHPKIGCQTGNKNTINLHFKTF
jgi:hypothetical protein